MAKPLIEPENDLSGAATSAEPGAATSAESGAATSAESGAATSAEPGMATSAEPPLISCASVTLRYGRKKVLSKLSFDLQKFQILGLLGDSGCGKSTAARMLTGLAKPSSGEVFLDGTSIYAHIRLSRRIINQKVQMIYQDSTNSFDPLKTIGTSLDIGQKRILNLNTAESRARSLAMLRRVGLDAKEAYYAKPGDLSGGECQRASIARALLIEPKILICDEATSNLDAGVAANIINLLKELKEEYKMSILFISHDLVLATAFCDEILIIKDGMILERLPAKRIAETMKNPYTIQLFADIIGTDPQRL
ncbi:ABC transporter ATP-binding protein [Mageeibacillus indolicus]|uniref:ABC transporter ATP-binding protein n=1 Tax=Mageeibacillus indolicus TaxID=884684 RepID=UPI000689DE98|nr:dipeptide/oligopeptide/nickel ABC transporter ATP-binding protein [Mageeibacillus indolicus]